jgi:glycosyltransferase involved in cell wall biosynthesis
MSLILKAGALARYIRENEIELIHAHLPWAGILSRIAGKLTGVPVVYSEHNKQERYHFLTRWMNALTINFLTEVIAVSADTARSIQTNIPWIRSPVRIICNGVDTKKFNRAVVNGERIRVALGIPEEAIIVGTVAVFRAQKRLDLWIKTAASIIESHKDVHFILVGDGPLRSRLESDLNKCSPEVQERIHLAGLQVDVKPYHAVFDIYLMTSLFEGLPVALLEAMSMECPVVATDAGGIREVVRDKIDGLLCDVNQPEQLLPLIRLLLDTKVLRDRYGKQSRQRVKQNFSLEKMVSDLESVYRRHTNSAI